MERRVRAAALAVRGHQLCERGQRSSSSSPFGWLSGGTSPSSGDFTTKRSRRLEGGRELQLEPDNDRRPLALLRGEHMATKETARRPSSRRRASRAPSKWLVARSGSASKQPTSRAAAVAARVRPKRSRARRKLGFRASVGRAFGDLTSGLQREFSRGAGKKRLAALLTGAAGALAATAAFVRRRGRRTEPPAFEPASPTIAATTRQPESDGQPAGDGTSAAPTSPEVEGSS
jgi:hypothetical protein